MSTFEIRDEEIDVEEIMERIRENIKKRRQQSGYSEVQRLLQEPGFQPEVSGVDLRENLHAADVAWQIQVRRPILSYRRFISRLVVKIRRLLQQEIRWTVDPIVDRQEYFNASVVRCLNAVAKTIEEKAKASVPRTTDEEFISLVYRAFFGRDPDPGGLVTHSRLLASGASRVDVMASMLRSPEFLHVNERSVEVPWCLARIRDARKVLDVGCSESTYLQFLGHLELHGIDTRDPLVGVPRNFHFIKGDVTQNVLPREFFDLVICISTLEHIGLEAYGMKPFADGDRLALNAMLSSLRENGRMLVTAPFGRKATHGWFRVYSEHVWRQLTKGLKITEEEFFKWNGKIYEPCSIWMLADIDYIQPESPLGKAGGLVCAEILKA